MLDRSLKGIVECSLGKYCSKLTHLYLFVLRIYKLVRSICSRVKRCLQQTYRGFWSKKIQIQNRIDEVWTLTILESFWKTPIYRHICSSAVLMGRKVQSNFTNFAFNRYRKQAPTHLLWKHASSFWSQSRLHSKTINILHLYFSHRNSSIKYWVLRANH